MPSYADLSTSVLSSTPWRLVKLSVHDDSNGSDEDTVDDEVMDDENIKLPWWLKALEIFNGFLFVCCMVASTAFVGSLGLMHSCPTGNLAYCLSPYNINCSDIRDEKTGKVTGSKCSDESYVLSDGFCVRNGKACVDFNKKSLSLPEN